MSTLRADRPSTPRRLVLWFEYTLGVVIAGFAALRAFVASALSGSENYGAAIMFGLIALLLFGLSLKQLFWKAPSGAVRFGVGYLSALALFAFVRFA